MRSNKAYDAYVYEILYKKSCENDKKNFEQKWQV